MLFLNYFFKRLDKRLNNFWEPYYIIDNRLNERNPIAGQVGEMRRAWHSASRIYSNYRQKTQTPAGLIKSFIPLTEEFYLRSHLSSTISVTANLLQDAHLVTNVLSRRLVASSSASVNNSADNAGEAAVTNIMAGKAAVQPLQSPWARFFKSIQAEKSGKPESFYRIKTQGDKLVVFENKLTR